MASYCFECGIEVPESRRVYRNERIFCSQFHAASRRETPAPPRIKSANQPKPAQDSPTAAPTTQAATGSKVPPAARGKIPGAA